MTVRFSCRCPNTDYLGFEASPEAIVAAAKKAEELGYDAIFANDHIIVGSDTRSAPWTNCYDPLVALAYMGAATSRIRIGVSVLIVPYRNPIATAKALATIDRMSGGRLIAGVGVGWNESEYGALGVPWEHRGARTNEYLRVWQACWGPDKVSFDGKFVQFAEMFVSPKPLQQPHPPFWSGGFSDGAMRRAARFSDVWQPTPMKAEDLVERMGALKKASDAIGRATPPETRMSFRVDFGKSSAADVVADLTRYRGTARLDAFQVNFHGNRDLAMLLESMERFMVEVKPKVG
ncbi:MAG TPA: LLM class F420-dependent oxidoreductase [Stellaceae bacterium]|jgi:probable F420-dependent oxidoreductase